MNDRYATTRMPYARATGAPPVMAGVYSCPELGRTCTRSGAYDALVLPSLFNGVQRERVAPAQAAAVSHASGALQVTTRARVAISDAQHMIAQPAPIARGSRSKRVKPRDGEQERPQGDYVPRKGSHVARVLDLLNAMPNDARLSIAEIHERFGLPAKQFQATFRLAFETRVLIFFVDAETRQRVVALPTSKAADPGQGARLLGPHHPEPLRLTDAA
jgi:hypothetical protein